MKAVRIHRFGGPDVLRPEEVETPSPQAGEVLVQVKSSGVNFIDIYQRTGLYPVPFPSILGCEAAGVIAEVGEEGTSTFVRGARVAFAGQPGTYAEYVAVPAERLVELPGRVSFEEGAALLLQGLTAHYLVRGAYLVKHGDLCVVHAAAGGVGALLVQLIKYFGGTVFAVVSTHEKALVARDAGADRVIVASEEDFETVVNDDTEGVNVVYDSVGNDTFERSLRVLAPRGTLVSYGQSSGPVPPFDPLLLSRGSLFLTRPRLGDYIATREELLHRFTFLVDLLLADRLRLRIDRVLPLAEAAEAHRLLESRKTAGKILLRVE